MRRGTPYLRRQYLLVVGVIGLLIAGIFAVFAQLLVGQLSRSYLEDVLLSGKLRAEEVARQFSGDEPTYRVLENRREALYKLAAALTKQEIIESIKFFDERGKLAFEIALPSEGYQGIFPEGHADFVPPSQPDKVTETERSYEVTVPMGDYGAVVATLSKQALASRIAVLRQQLLLHTATTGVLTVLVLGVAVAFIWHLIQRNAALEERRRRDEELAQLGTLAANLAHEIRNPLNALSLNLELLAEELDTEEGERGTVGQARREVQRLSRLVNDFLVYARPVPPSRESCPVDELVGDLVKFLTPMSERAGVALEVRGGGFRVPVDRAQMSQVLMNLALNGFQAMEGTAGGKLVIAARRQGDEAVIEIADSGPGIAETDLGRVREAFFSRRKGGTGLGLPIADRIVQEHGGRIELVNGEAGGLVARIVVPAEKAATGNHGRAA